MASLEAENREIVDQVGRGVRFWNAALDIERGAREAIHHVQEQKEEAARLRAEAMIARVEDKRAALLAEDRLDPETAALLSQVERSWRDVIAETNFAADVRLAELRVARADAADRRKAHYRRRSVAVRQLEPYSNALNPWGRISISIPVDLPGWSASLYATPSSLGATFRFGKLLGSRVEASQDQISSGVKTCLEVAELTRACVGWRSSMTADGFATGPFMELDVAPWDSEEAERKAAPPKRGGLLAPE